LQVRAPLKGTITFDSHGDRGRFQDRLELIFLDMKTAKRFAIVKPLMSIVGNKEDYELLKPTAPYIPKHWKQRDPIDELVPGERPPAITDIKWRVKLPDYEMPEALKTVLGIPAKKEKHRLIRSLIPTELTVQTHSRWFHALLYAEEHQSRYEYILFITHWLIILALISRDMTKKRLP
jgi:helicase MOV-10